MRKKYLLCILLAGLFCCAALGFTGALADTASDKWNDPDSWKGAPGYGDNTVVRQGSGTCIIEQKQNDDFATSYLGESFYVDGFTATFKVEKPQVDGNIKLIFTDTPGWYTGATAAFTLDFQQGSGNTLSSITQNVKYPGGGNEIGSFKGVTRKPVFYWDGSKDNVFRMYFKADGLLYFNVNGTELDSSASELNTARLETLGILDSFADGKGWLSVWAAQVKKKATLTFTSPFATMDDPVFADSDSFTGWQKVDGGQLQTALDGVRRLSFRSKDGSAFAVKKTSFNDVSGMSANFMFGAESGKSVTAFFDNGTAAASGSQLRIRFVHTDSDNVIVSTFDGTTESELGRFSESFAVATPPSGTAAALKDAELIRIQLKRAVGDYYILRVNGNQLNFTSEQSSRLGKFLSENFEKGAAFGLSAESASSSTAIKTAAIVNLSSGAAVTDWVKVSDSDTAVLGRDGNYVQMYTDAVDGVYRVRNAERTFWLDRFGVNVRVQANRPGDRPSIRMILSDDSEGWYETQDASAAIMEFVCDGEATAVKLFSYRGGTENLLASGSTKDFGWNYDAVNQIRFGMTADGWSVVVNEYPVVFEADFQSALDALAGDFEDGIAYLSVQGGGAPETSVTVEQYFNLIEAYGAPRGWGKGHYLVEPRWGEKGADEQAAFGTPGGGYTVQMTNSVPVTGFKMVLKATPGSTTSYATFALNSAHSDWYNTSNAIGFLLFSGPNQDLDHARFGLVVADAARGIQGVEAFSDTADFKWYRENTIEIKMYRGEYGFYVNGKKLFADIRNAWDGNRGFHDYMTDLNEKFYLNRAKLQVFGDAGDMTFVVTEINQIEPKNPPSRVNSEKARLEELTYSAGKEISIDLSKLYTSKDGLDLTFEASVGTVDGSVWTYTPESAGELSVTFKCTDSEGQSGLSTELKLNVAGTETSGGGCGKTSSSAGLILLAGVLLAAGVKFVR